MSWWQRQRKNLIVGLIMAAIAGSGLSWLAPAIAKPLVDAIYCAVMSQDCEPVAP